MAEDKRTIVMGSRDSTVVILSAPNTSPSESLLARYSGVGTRLPPIWPGLDSQIRRHMWAEFVGFLLCSERFSPGLTPVFPSPQKPIWFDTN